MRVLLITSPEEDYLQDSIIHGFKELLGADAIDYPIKDILYNDYDAVNNLRGNGFTLYGLLDSKLNITNQLNIEKDINDNKFDLIIFTSIYRQYDFFYKYFSLLKKTKSKIWIIDGEDTSLIFPYLPKHLKKFLFSPKPYNHFTYFKRELYAGNSDKLQLKISDLISKAVLNKKKIKPISFSIPQSKVLKKIPHKTKLFNQHIVDEEVAKQVPVSNTQYVFKTEDDYYHDIQQSKFGITTKRAGWDCMRHYEIAANGSVLCFKNLTQKPALSAPHGLIENKNCISYSNYAELINKIKNISDEKYNDLAQNSLQWISANTTIERVKSLLGENLYN